VRVEVRSKPLDQGVDGEGTDDEAPRLAIQSNGWHVEGTVLANYFRAGVHVALRDGQTKLVRGTRNLNPVRTADGLRPCRREVNEGHDASVAQKGVMRRLARDGAFFSRARPCSREQRSRLVSRVGSHVMAKPR